MFKQFQSSSFRYLVLCLVILIGLVFTVFGAQNPGSVQASNNPNDLDGMRDVSANREEAGGPGGPQVNYQAQSPEVVILVVDDFVGRRLLSIADPVLGAEVLTSVTNWWLDGDGDPQDQGYAVDRMEVFICSVLAVTAIDDLDLLAPTIDDLDLSDIDLPSHCDEYLDHLDVDVVALWANLFTTVEEQIANEGELYDDIEVNIQEDLCVVGFPEFTTDGQGHYGNDGAGGTDNPHGEVVLTLVEALIPVYDPYAPHRVSVEDVDTNHYTTSGIAYEIETKMADFGGANFVINMSFAIIPCDLLPTLAFYEAYLEVTQGFSEESGIPLNELDAFHLAVDSLIEDFYDGVVNNDLINWSSSSGLSAEDCFGTIYNPEEAGEESSLTLIGGLAQDEPEESCDPLLDLLSENVVMIASAGNFGRSYPFWPAAWEEVVSVSASDLSNGNCNPHPDVVTITGQVDVDFFTNTLVNAPPPTPCEDPFSNSGEVSLPGGWHETVNGNQQGVFGTSFAAPRLSFLVALTMARNHGVICPHPSHNGIWLSFMADWTSPVEWDFSGTFTNGVNQPLPYASDNHCLALSGLLSTLPPP